MIPPIAYTPGEPGGIGPDIILQLAHKKLHTPIVVIADRNLLITRAQQLKLPASIIDTLDIKHVPTAQPTTTGKLAITNVPYVLETLREASKGCMEGLYAAMVTGPVHKGVINDAGIPFSGQTEFLAEFTHAKHPVMMLATDKLRVALATTHLPLKDVAAAITQKSLTQTIIVLHHDLITRFKIPNPRILVCGLNPHAGEGGHLGHEEIDTIIPVLNQLRAQGMQLIGPLPADTIFTPQHLQHADAVLAMYHDQGLPVLKAQGFGHAVNITLGLPIIRTSVDHGTALEIAGSGKAEIGSLIAAIEIAMELCNAPTT